MESKDISFNIGGNFFSMLTLLFIALKLTHYIEWSWFWVLSPIIIPLLIYIIICIVILIVAIIIGLSQ